MRQAGPVILVAGAATMLSGGCSRTGEKLAQIPSEATREEVVRMMGPPVSVDQLPSAAQNIPSGCSSQLVYEDQYQNKVIRRLAGKMDSSRTFIHVCFDADGRKMNGLTFTLIDY